MGEYQKMKWVYKPLLFVFIVSFFITRIVMAGNNGLAFLKIDVDGRAAALGGAYSALSEDATAVFWNPAGLANSKGKSLVLMHNEWLADITQEFAALQFYQGKHNFALAMNLINIPGIEIRGNSPTEDPDGVVSAINLSATVSYATTIFENWQIGGSFKYLHEKYFMAAANGWAVDLGLQRRLGENIQTGLTIQNLGRMQPLLNASTPLPALARAGVAYSFPFYLLGRRPLITGDLQYIFGEEILGRFGVEFGFQQYLALRLGYVTGSDTQSFTTGLGLDYSGYHLDYAFAPFEYDLGNTHRISFGFSF
ncbi:MAG TPA: PorV/PorQ family protein [Calditrichaeota bacterium]|nr:PorV/PorQ family protein [Calditrichota bacterium]